MASVAVGWLVYAKTNSAFALGFVGLAQFVPMVLLSFVIGHMADHYDRRKIVYFCQFAEAVTLGSLFLLQMLGILSPAAIFAGVVILGAARAFEQPTMSALLPGLVPINMLDRAIASSVGAMQTAFILGPAVAGLLFSFGPSIPLGLSSFLLALSSGAVLMIRMETQPPRREKITLASVFSGFSFVVKNPILMGSISLDLFAVLLGGATALMPIFARDILHSGALSLGMLRAAPAIGAVGMSIFLARWPLQRGVGQKMFLSVVVFGGATLVFGLSENLIVSLAALAVLGAADNVSVVIRSSLVLLSTPDAMRGRVNAVNSLFIGTSNQLGEFESGVTAGLFGPVPSVVIGGCGTILIALLWMKLFPALRNAQTLAGEAKS